MSDKNCEQKQYGHRFRELLQTTGNLGPATRHGVLRSTAQGWLKRTRTSLTYIDVLDMDAQALQRDLLWIARRETLKFGPLPENWFRCRLDVENQKVTRSQSGDIYKDIISVDLDVK